MSKESDAAFAEQARMLAAQRARDSLSETFGGVVATDELGRPVMTPEALQAAEEARRAEASAVAYAMSVLPPREREAYARELAYKMPMLPAEQYMAQSPVSPQQLESAQAAEGVRAIEAQDLRQKPLEELTLEDLRKFASPEGKGQQSFVEQYAGGGKGQLLSDMQPSRPVVRGAEGTGAAPIPTSPNVQAQTQAAPTTTPLQIWPGVTVPYRRPDA